ncbi:MAG: YraN family protein [Methylophilaceae bacterium 17-44-8]|jgi:putative endonuclease|nr:MAG: YraN family protein [Methylophilales bacterium 28-44-11]OYY94645.1 MAG: YraN family protein [Methylophilales bacterium 16-45-7]OZA05498.1 MAG: YraN family protein [Methylophilaceae bacterium 17-44-8]
MKLNADNPGLAAEKIAATFLTQQGLKLITANFHCRYGEIDLIMQEGNTLVFVEVRLRTNTKFGSAATSITKQKQQKLIHTAQFYLQQHAIQSPCRFDAVLMQKADLTQIEWLRNAIDT